MIRFTPSPVVGAGAPLGELVAADFVPGDPRRGFYTSEGEGHRLIVGPSGSGKFQAVIAPLLLTADAASVIIFDVANGEAYRDTSRHRANLGPVLALDPFNLRGGGGSINPLDLLRADDPQILSKARRLADALMIFGKAGGDSDYWNGQALNFMVALLIHVATSPDEAGSRTLQRVREIIRRPFTADIDPNDPHAFDKWPNGRVFFSMLGSSVAGNIVRDEAENILAPEGGKNAFYIQQTMRENTAFLDLPEVQQVTASTSLDLRTLRERVSSLYVIVPEYELRNVGRWLRAIYAVVLEQMRGGADGGKVPLHVVLDEFPSFGRFDRVTDDMARVRKFGIRFHVAVQKLSQLRSLYGDGWETFVPVLLQVLGSDENFTSEYVSKRLGTTTKPSTSESHNRATAGGSQGSSRSWTSAPLMPPHEVGALDPARCLVIATGHQPLNVRKWALHGSSWLQARTGTMAPPRPRPAPLPASAANRGLYRYGPISVVQR